jgi:hypothetical protein
MDNLELLQKVKQEILANFAKVALRILKALDPSINPDKPPRNFKEAMKAIDRHGQCIFDSWAWKWNRAERQSSCILIIIINSSLLMTRNTSRRCCSPGRCQCLQVLS